MKEENNKKWLVGYYNKSVILTYIGVMLSITGIITIMNGYLAHNDSLDRIPIAMIYFVLAGVCDLFDGFIARKCKRTDKEKEFGVQIDSLADTVSFVIFPVILLCRMDYRHSMVWIVSVVYVICGVIRLAYFNITTEENKGFFKGLPVTYSAVIIPLTYVITRILEINDIMVWVYLAIAILFILNFKLKKPTGIWYLILPVLAVFTICSLVIV